MEERLSQLSEQVARLAGDKARLETVLTAILVMTDVHQGDRRCRVPAWVLTLIRESLNTGSQSWEVPF